MLAAGVLILPSADASKKAGSEDRTAVWVTCEPIASGRSDSLAIEARDLDERQVEVVGHAGRQTGVWCQR